MSLGDAHRFRELVEQVDRLMHRERVQHEEIATLKLRLSSLQGQINSLRAATGRIPITPPDAPANSHGADDAA